MSEGAPRASNLYFEELGEDFDAFMSDYDVSQRARLICECLDSLDELDGAALEVGCGTGAISRHIQPKLADLTVSDISLKLSQAVGERLDCKWSEADAVSLPFADHSYDVVVSSELIEHTPAPEEALREMARVLKPGGCLIVTSPNRLWWPVLLFAEFTGLRKFRGNEHWLWPRQAARVLEGEGLVVEKVSGVHLFPWQIPGAKAILPFFDRFGSTLYPLMINFAVFAHRPVSEERR